MGRYERTIQFERWCAMREAYRIAPPDERRAVMSVDDAIQLAEALLHEQASDKAGSSPASTASDFHDS